MLNLTGIVCLTCLMLYCRSPGVVYNRNGVLSNSSQSSNSRQIRPVQPPTNHVPKTAPPAYSEIGQPIFNVQNEMKTTSLNTSR